MKSTGLTQSPYFPAKPWRERNLRNKVDKINNNTNKKVKGKGEIIKVIVEKVLT